MIRSQFLCLSLGFLLSASAAWSDEAQDALVLEGLGRALEENPGDAAARMKRGMYHLWRTFDYAKAKEDFDQVISLEPENSAAYIGRADVYTGWDSRFYDPSLAKVDAEMALKFAPKSSEVFRILGDLAGHPGMGTPEDSFRHYKQAVELDPNNLLAQVGLAYTYSKAGTEFHSEAKSLEHAQIALEIDPNEAIALEAMGDLLSSDEAGRADGLRFLNRAVQANSRNVGTRLSRGYTYLVLAMDTEWEALIEAVQEQGVTVIDTIRGNKRLLKQALKKLGPGCHLARALSDFDRAHDLCPHSDDVFSAQAYALQNIPGQERQALQCYNRVVELSPNSATALIERAEFLVANPQLMIDPKAVDAFKEGEDVDAAALGEMIAKRFPLVSQQLEKDLTKALEVEKTAKAFYLRGSLRASALQDRKGAVSDLTEAIALDPLDASFYEARASLHDAFGHDEEAEADRARVSDLEDLD